MIKIKAKKINDKDSKFLFNLKNESGSLKNSLIKRKIEWQEHNLWLKKTLKNRKNIFYTYSYNKKNVAFVRFGNIYDSTFEVSIACKQKFQNKGIGKFILNDCEKKLRKNSVLLAKIVKQNKKSIRLFELSGYQKLNNNKKYFLFYKIVNKNISLSINDIIKKIELTRKKNNLNWMELLKLSFNTNPSETKKIFYKIYKTDKEINNLSKKIIKKK